MTRGVRFLGLNLKERMARIYDEIESGAFAREWAGRTAGLRFRVVRFLAMRQRINRIEQKVRKSLGLRDLEEIRFDSNAEAMLDDPAIRAELESFSDTFEF
jgi:ketol-acid reductoisomerase